MFISHGKCSDYNSKGVVRTYLQVSKNKWPGTAVTYKNMNDYSCLNGWTMGDISTSAMDAARFFYYYLGTQKLISFQTRDKLLNIEDG